MKFTPIRMIVALAMAAFVALVGNTAQAANTALVDGTKTATLTIHKYNGDATGQPNNGTQQNVTLPPLAGITFDVYQVFTDSAKTTKVDLTTNAGWATAQAVATKALSPAEIAAGQFTVNGVTYYLGSKVSKVTDANGVAAYSYTNGAGLYLVNENLTAGTTNNPDKNSLTPVSPYFVTLPVTDPNNTSQWLYDVHTYPKNQKDVPTKFVDSKGSKVGDAITYSIYTPITNGMSAAQMKMYSVVDNLDANLGQPTTKVFIDADGNPATTGDRTALVEGTDYHLVPDTTSPYTVRVVMDQPGLDKLVAANNANSAAQVLTQITTTVVGEGNGSISNSAEFYPNATWVSSHGGDPSNPENPGVPGIPTTNPAVVKYGDLKITKVDGNATSTKLGGAKFAVYIDPTPGTTCTASDVNGTALIANAGTTDANGSLTVTGLQTSDFYNNATQVEPNLQKYCLVETTAPSGYNLLAEPIQFSILQSTATATTPALTSLTVNNQKSSLLNSLPLTGGKGALALGIVGVLLVAAGAAYYGAPSRRRRDELA